MSKAKTCSHCNKEFICKADDIQNCHCSTVKLTPEQQNILQKEYNDCLCNDCLNKMEKKSETQKNPYSGKKGIYEGLIWGLFMFLFMGVLYPKYVVKELLTTKRLIFDSVFWVVAGFGWAYSMKLYFNWRIKKGKTV